MHQVLIIASIAATVIAGPTPWRSHDPATIKSCIDWYDNYGQSTCQRVLSALDITPAEFHAWNPSVGLDCTPWWPVSYCVLTQEKLDAWEKNHTTTTSTTTTVTTTSTSTSTSYPTPTAWLERGCYSDENKDASVMNKLISPAAGDAKLTVTACENTCSHQGYRFAGLENGNQCWCSQYVAGEWAKDQQDCNMACSGDDKALCGGKDRVFVYGAQYRDPSHPVTTTTSRATSSTPSASPAAAETSAETNAKKNNIGSTPLPPL